MMAATHIWLDHDSPDYTEETLEELIEEEAERREELVHSQLEEVTR